MPASTDIAGGNERVFRLFADGDMSAASIRYARNIGYGGPSFGGAAAAAAREQWERMREQVAAALRALYLADYAAGRLDRGR